jgi:hypothetical protein
VHITDTVPTELTARRLRPTDVKAVFIGGSLALGWAHARSDADIFVVSGDRWVSDTAEAQRVSLEPDTVPVEAIHVDGQRWEIRYWLESQIDQLLDRLSWEAFEANTISLTAVETACVERLFRALPVEGARWLAERRERISGSALQAYLTSQSLARADSYVEDVVGLIESGDVTSAVLAAQFAFANLVDAVNASSGEFGQEWKWRARRMRANDPEMLPYEEYWAIATMRSFDPDRPEAWARHVIDVCRRVSADVPIG